MGKGRKSKQNKKRTSKPRANWISTAILRSLADEANELIDDGAVKYHSLTEFVCDAVRRRLEDLRPKVEPEKVLGAVPA
jgi:hypothetical protein